MHPLRRDFFCPLFCPAEAVPLQDAIEQAKATPLPKHGGERNKDQADNVSLNSDPKHGNAQTYTLRRLARDNPELLKEVEAKRLTPNQAAIKTCQVIK